MRARAAVCYGRTRETLAASDSWQSDLTEGEDHETVQALRERDVYQTFLDNVAEQTQGNVEVHREDCFEFLQSFSAPIKFCHVDAAHDYDSVKRTIELLLPLLVNGGVLCGDDYASAHAGRADLGGGVQRAVDELLTGRGSAGNFWYWLNES